MPARKRERQSMLGLLADVNAEGHVYVLLKVCESDAWRDVWTSLYVRLFYVEELGLPRNINDVDLWRFCQERSLILITGNRNDKGPVSLQAAIRRFGDPNSLPVLTIADPDRKSTRLNSSHLPLSRI